MNEHKNCPFCGTNNKLSAQRSSGWATSNQPYEVRCFSCGIVIQFPKSYNVKTAFEFWDMRSE